MGSPMRTPRGVFSLMERTPDSSSEKDGVYVADQEGRVAHHFDVVLVYVAEDSVEGVCAVGAFEGGGYDDVAHGFFAEEVEGDDLVGDVGGSGAEVAGDEGEAFGEGFDELGADAVVADGYGHVHFGGEVYLGGFEGAGWRWPRAWGPR